MYDELTAKKQTTNESERERERYGLFIMINLSMTAMMMNRESRIISSSGPIFTEIILYFLLTELKR